jgi:hypothetical protein
MLINAVNQHDPPGTGMCQPESIAQVIDFEGNQKPRFLVSVAD